MCDLNICWGRKRRTDIIPMSQQFLLVYILRTKMSTETVFFHKCTFSLKSSADINSQVPGESTLFQLIKQKRQQMTRTEWKRDEMFCLLTETWTDEFSTSSRHHMKNIDSQKWSMQSWILSKTKQNKLKQNLPTRFSTERKAIDQLFQFSTISECWCLRRKWTLVNSFPKY